MATNGVPMAAMSRRIFIVFIEDAPLLMVIVFRTSLVAYKRLGNTSNATVASKAAIVTAELRKCVPEFRLF